MSRIINPTLGSDPEVFIYAEEPQKIVSVIGMIGGTKNRPKPIPNAPGFYVQEDNVLAEYNIPPSSSRDGFVAAVHDGLSLLQGLLPPRHTLKIQSSHMFEPEQLTAPQALVLGCEPDINAWTGEENNPPSIRRTPNLRSSGGHVIVGYRDVDFDVNQQLIRMMDALLGVPSVLLDRDMNRRKLYGKAGSFRHKFFGVEYRTLSSFWLQSRELTGWIWDQTLTAIDKVNNNDLGIIKHKDVIVDIINNGDVESAELFVDQYEIAMP